MYQYRTLENTSFEQLAEYFTGTYPQGDYRRICFDRIGIFFMDDEILARICTGIYGDKRKLVSVLQNLVFMIIKLGERKDGRDNL